MAPAITKRDGEPEGEEGTGRRTRVDDTDPSIVFTPGPSPYLNQQQKPLWTVIKNSAAFNGSAVMTNHTEAQLSFNFTGDSLTLGLLYKKDGTKLQVTLENGSSFPVEVTAAEAAASAHDGDKEALQKKNFRLTGLSCANHTITLTPLPAGDDQGGNSTSASLYFDWFSFPSADNPNACSSSPASTDAVSLQRDDHTMEYIGIGLGATLFGFITAILITRYFRRREQRQTPSTAADPVDRTYRPPGRKQTSDETLNLPLNMSQPSIKPSLETAPIFRPRGIHALAHDESFSSTHTGPRQSTIESPSATAVFPLMPISQGEHVEMIEDAGHSIGNMLLCLEHDPPNRPREVRNSGSKVQYEKARLSSIATAKGVVPGSPTLVGGYELKRMPKSEFTTAATSATRTASKGKAKSRSTSRRPRTTSAVDRLRTEAKQLNIQRPLSPFDRTRPTTSSGATSSKPNTSSLPRLATAPANSSSQNRFRRNSSGSVDTRWSRHSAEASSLDCHKDRERAKGQVDVGKEKTSDSEADMWINGKVDGRKGKKRRNSIADAPKRPPKSPHRPSTGGGGVPPAMAY
ncbi:uncharacterized protein SPSC_05189 [Sporisorium scitamineum]|uniref:Uncharacterized protein n=1 Tax=Sporisorium scitamineum TaxID=49012 RepID=A0A0F7S052_9BASI|nr:hypothetical protein [Sporisorium scitamineum]CDU25355.1 uncharacterized protein SPSC_05189 [Sporisorium scitamineum]